MAVLENILAAGGLGLLGCGLYFVYPPLAYAYVGALLLLAARNMRQWRA